MPAENANLKSRRVVLAVSIGNALEWFDFAVYGFFAATLAKVFFPAESETASLLLAFAAFGITFIVRPLGAAVVGSLSDRYGRKPALIVTIVLMTIGTAMIAFSPTYERVGIVAPLIVVSARVLQGISAGGEFGSATAFLAEQHPMHRGYYSSWQFASQGLTSVLATTFGVGLSTLLSTEQLTSWGWRVPFLFGLLIGPVAYYLRRELVETSEFQTTATTHAPVQALFSNAKTGLSIAIGAVVLGTVATYTIVFMPTYAARHLGLPLSSGFIAGLIAATITMGLIPVFGALSDVYGRTPVAIPSAMAIFLLIFPLFALLSFSPTLQTLILFEAIFAILLSIYAGALPALMSELFPPEIRTSGLSISYAVGVAAFGGFAPFINEILISSSGSILAPSYYLMLAAAISLGALLAARRQGVR